MRNFANRKNKKEGMQAIYTILTALPATACSCMAAGLIWDWQRHKSNASFWLALWAVVTAMLYCCHYIFFNRSEHLLPAADSIYTVCNLLVFPLFYMFLHELADGNASPQRHRKQSLMLLILILPLPLTMGLVTALLYAAMTWEEKMQFAAVYLYGSHKEEFEALSAALATAHDVQHALFAVSVVAVMVMGYRKIRKYNETLAMYYADTDDKNLHRMTGLLVLFIIISACSIASNFMGRHSFMGTLWIALPSVAFSILLPLIALSSASRKPLALIVADERAENTDEIEEIPTVKRMLREKFEEVMEKEQLFLQPDLRLDQVALAIGTNRTYLLEILRRDMDMTFKEYVNRRRIEYAERLMEKNPETPKNEIASRSGYNTFSSFYRNMKQYGRGG